MMKEDSTPNQSALHILIENVQNCSEPARIPICRFCQMGCSCKFGMSSKKGGQCRYLHPRVCISPLSYGKCKMTDVKSFTLQCVMIRAGEPELGARELGFFEGAEALFSHVSGAGAGAIKIFGSSSSCPIIEKV